MNILKPNTESTTLDRLRIVLGTLMTLAGIAVFGFIFITGYTDTIHWIIAFGLILSGVIITGLHRITEIVFDLLR